MLGLEHNQLQGKDKRIYIKVIGDILEKKKTIERKNMKKRENRVSHHDKDHCVEKVPIEEMFVRHLIELIQYKYWLFPMMTLLFEIEEMLNEYFEHLPPKHTMEKC